MSFAERVAFAGAQQQRAAKSLPQNDSTTALHLFVCFRCFNSNKTCEILRIQEQNTGTHSYLLVAERAARDAAEPK